MVPKIKKYSPVGGKGGMLEQPDGEYIKLSHIEDMILWKVAAIKKYPELANLPYPPPTRVAHS